MKGNAKNIHTHENSTVTWRNATTDAIYMGNILNLNIFLIRGGDLAYGATITLGNSAIYDQKAFGQWVVKSRRSWKV